MRKLTFIILSCLMTFTLHAESLTGKWNFEAPNAPYGFQNGTVEFKNVDNKTVAMIDFGHLSYEFDVNEDDKNHFSSQIPVMGDEVDVKLDNTNGKMKTVVNTMGLVIDVKLSKVSECKK